MLCNEEKLWERIRKHRKKHTNGIGAFLILLLFFVWFILPLIKPIFSLQEQLSITGGIVLSLVVLLLESIVDMNQSIKGLYSFHVNKNSTDVSEKLISYIKTEKPNKAHLFEFSTRTIQGLLSAFEEIGTEIFLLIQDPGKAISVVEKERICGGIKDFITGTFSNYENITIRCYRQRASYKGRKLSNKIINVGWYTYDIRDINLGEDQIWGHNNPMITLSLDTKEGRIIEESFNKIFKNLWDRGSYINEVCGKCGKRAKCFSGIQEVDARLNHLSTKELSL